MKFTQNELNALNKNKLYQANLQAAQSGQNLSSQLSDLASKQNDNGNWFTNLIGGIGQKVGDFGKTAVNIGQTIAGKLSQEGNAQAIKDISAQDSQRRNDIAKKYGYNSYGDAMNAGDNAPADMWKELQSSNEQTKQTQSANNQARNAQFGNVKKIDLQDAQAAGLNTIGTVLDFLGAAGNVAGGAVEGLSDAVRNADKDAYKTNGLSSLNAGDVATRTLSGTGGALVGGKVGAKLGGSNTILGSALKSGATGAAAGATSGGISALGTGQNVLGGALQGAVSGAEGGALTGGVNSAIGKGLNKLGNLDNNIKSQNADNTGTQKVQNQSEQANTISSSLTPEKIKELDMQDNIKNLIDQRNTIGAQNDYGFQDVSARRSNYSKSLKDAYGSLVAAGLNNRNEMTNAARMISDPESGTFQKARRSILNDTGTIDIKAPGNGLSDSELSTLAKGSGLNDKQSAEAVNQITNMMTNSMPENANLSDVMNGKINALDADDLVKSIEKLASDTRKASGSSTTATPTSNFYSKVAKNLSDTIDNAADPQYKSFISDNTNVQKMLGDITARYPKYGEYLQNELGKANSLSEMRSIMQDLVITSKAGENSVSNINSAPSVAKTFGDNIAANPSTNPLDLAKKAVRTAAEANNTPQKQVSRLNNEIAKAQKELENYQNSNNNANTNGVKKFAQNAKTYITDKAGKIANTAKNINQLGYEFDPNNALSRIGYQSENRGVTNNAINNANNSGIDANMQYLINNYAGTYGTDNANAVVNSLRDTQNFNNTNNKSLSDALSSLDNSNVGSAYSDLIGQQDTTEQDPQMTQLGEQMQQISNGMNNALAAGDFTSYAKLADMYGTASDLYTARAKQVTPTTSSSTTKLTDTQRKAAAAQNQLDTLSKMTPDTGTFLKSTPLAGLIDLTGGNDYANQSDALAMQLGYMMSGAQINANEARKIGSAYVPSATDSATTRKNKIARTQQLINDYLSSTTGDVQQ